MPALCVEPAGIPEPSTVSCVTAAPILKKMKVLKKFTQRMSRGTRPETPQLPPLLFHQVCGDNVRIDNNGRVARRVESFCKGISFSNRSVKVGERIYVKLLEISTNWSGVIRFGFTSQDPMGLRDALPKYACPDLTSKPGYWAKALSERFAEEGLVLFYYVTSSGDVHFGINGEEKGLFFSGVETRAPLWAIIDVYGNSTAIEFLDPKSQLNNRVRVVNNDLRSGSSSQRRTVSTSHLTHLYQQHPPMQSIEQRLASGNIRNVDAMSSAMVQLTLEKIPSRYHPAATFTPFAFHRVRGRHVHLNEDRSLVTRVDSEYSHGYVFTGRPLRPGERFVIKILETEPVYVGALAFGLTAANPAGLEATDLPEDCDLLLDRPEYWVVSKDVASSPVPGDELTFGLTHQGEVTFCKNNGPSQTVMHVDISLQLWAFFDVYGNTKKIRMLGLNEESPNNHNESNANADFRRTAAVGPSRQVTSRNPFLQCPPEENPTTRSYLQKRIMKEREANRSRSEILPARASGSCLVMPAQGSPGESSPPSQHECTICYEKLVDSVLYTCGHMCMCYECAHQQWQGRGGGLCPICRAPIRDVIRTYRS